MKPIPRYVCHKTVEAYKIKGFEYRNEGVVLVPEDPDIEPVIVMRAYVQIHRPYPGGYYVRYADGYESFSPAVMFEDGYKLIEPAVEQADGES